MRDHSSPDGVEFNVAHAGQKISLAINQGCFVPTFPQRTGTPVSLIHVSHVGPPQVLHEMSHAMLRHGRDEQVNVIGHQDVGVQPAMVAPSGFFEIVEISPVVGVRVEARLTIIAPLDNVLRDARKDESGLTGQGHLRVAKRELREGALY